MSVQSPEGSVLFHLHAILMDQVCVNVWWRQIHSCVQADFSILVVSVLAVARTRQYNYRKL